VDKIALATVVVTAVCTSFAALLVLAERYLLNYGRCRIRVNAGTRELEVQGGNTLLASLMGQGIFIPSACGGKGTCAYCKVQVTSGGGPVVPTEQPLLTAAEIAQGVRISCQVKVRNDVEIVIPDDLLSVREYTATVEAIRDLTHDIKLLRLRLTEPATLDFVPGQYVQLEAPPHGANPEAVYRAYSIASLPSDSGHLELIIRLVPGGICTTWVFTELKEGMSVRLNGPYGQFRLTETDRPMVWIAGGSGMAPFWSMVRHMREKHVDRPCTYFFGAVAPRDLFLTEELAKLTGEMPNFHFVPALSGKDLPADWAGQRGLITEVVDRHVPAADDGEAYLCGGSGMIDAAVKVLHAKGFTDQVIFYDKFT
jgi:Na+-transporting NADH:ubiquinone oxidoreductase subunit F